MNNLMKKIFLVTLLIFSCFVSATAQYMFTLQINTNRIAFDSKRNVILATVNGNDDNYANSLVSINPYTGKVLKNVFVGSEPTKLFFTTDSNYIFICFDDLMSIKKFDLNSFTVVQEIKLGLNGSYGMYYGESIAVLPNNDSTIIVTMKTNNSYVEPSGAVVFSNGKQLPNVASDRVNNPDDLLSTGTDTIFGYTTSSTSYSFCSILVSPDSGASILKMQWFTSLTNPQYYNGFVYDDLGIRINPNTPSIVDTFNLHYNYGFQSFACAPDISKNKIFYSGANNDDPNIEFYRFNKTTTKLEAQYTISNIIPQSYQIPAVSQLIRFGNNGLATTVYDNYYFTTNKPFLAILNNSSFVDSVHQIDTSSISKLVVNDTIFTHIQILDTVNSIQKDTITFYATKYIATHDTLVLYSQLYKTIPDSIISTVRLIASPKSNSLSVVTDNYNFIPNFVLQIVDESAKELLNTTLISENFDIDISNFGKGTFKILLTIPGYQNTVSNKNLIIK
jgi:hypothetical protein